MDHLLVNLLYFRLAVLGSTDPEDPAWPVVGKYLKSPLGRRRVRKRRAQGFGFLPLDARLTALRLGEPELNSQLGVSAQDVEEELLAEFAELEEKGVPAGFPLDDAVVERQHLRDIAPLGRAFLLLRTATRRDSGSPSALLALRQLLKPNASGGSQRFPPTGFSSDRVLLQPVLGWRRPVIPVAREAQLPLGLWPEPLMAAALLVAKGPEAVEESLRWLGLARSTYGYTWRVLVDWRYFEGVKEHPAFREFLRAEDEEVEAIEAAIDRGEFTL